MTEQRQWSGGMGEYQRRARTETSETKRCTGCEELKPLVEFTNQTRGRKGVHARCKPCMDAYQIRWRRTEGARERRRDYKRTPHAKTKSRQAVVVAKYGFEALAVEDRRTAPDASCDACGGDRRLVIDHDHKTEFVRGVLCHGCNVALGLLQDDPARIQSLLAYALLHVNGQEPTNGPHIMVGCYQNAGEGGSPDD